MAEGIDLQLILIEDGLVKKRLIELSKTKTEKCYI